MIMKPIEQIVEEAWRNDAVMKNFAKWLKRKSGIDLIIWMAHNDGIHPWFAKWLTKAK